MDAIIARVYPDRVWGAPDAEASLGAGPSPSEVQRLGRQLAVATRAPTYFRPGEPEDLCNYVWILCVGRAPCLLDLRDGVELAVDADLAAGSVRERYLRVAFSTIGRMATVQEVTLELERDTSGGCLVTEASRPGVYDPMLLKRMRATVDLIEANDLEHIDFGLLARPLEGAVAAAYVERFGIEPQLVNYLFFAAPVETTRAIAW